MSASLPIALPVLAANRLRATFGIYTSVLGTSPTLYLSNAQVAEIAAAGHQVSSHNINNYPLDNGVIVDANKQTAAAYTADFVAASATLSGLAGELFDGWLAIFYNPEFAPELLSNIEAGRAKVDKTLAGFDVVPTVPVVFGDDVEQCAMPVRAYSALYIGGMGSRDKNFYNQLATRMGYEQAAIEIQDKYLAKDQLGAMAAVPLDFIDKTALIGPRDRVRDRLQAYADSGVTTLTVATYAGSLEERIATLRTMVEVVEQAGLAE